MAETEQYENRLYSKMRLSTRGKAGDYIPISLLKEWEKVRLMLNPNAKEQDLMKYEN